MATATAPPPGAEPVPHRFTVTDYFRMAEAGIPAADDRVTPLTFPELAVVVTDLLPPGAPEPEG